METFVLDNISSSSKFYIDAFFYKDLGKIVFGLVFQLWPSVFSEMELKLSGRVHSYIGSSFDG
jgi:hypothetical protein